MEDFRGKVVLITGSSAGLGAATAVYLAARGARLSLTGRNENKLKGVAQQCQEAGLKPTDILTTVGDLTDETFRTQLVSRTVDTFGQLDVLVQPSCAEPEKHEFGRKCYQYVKMASDPGTHSVYGDSCLVNNAGGAFSPDKFADPGMEIFLATMNINVNAQVSMSKLAVPHLLRSKGNIVNMSSDASVRPLAGFGAYCTSKAALDMFTKTLALELAPEGVRVNSVNPGYIPTEITRHSNFDSAQTAEFEEKQRKTHPIGRLGTPEDIARVVAFLASDKSSFITGETLVVDGAARYGGIFDV